MISGTIVTPDNLNKDVGGSKYTVVGITVNSVYLYSVKDDITREYKWNGIGYCLEWRGIFGRYIFEDSVKTISRVYCKLHYDYYMPHIPDGASNDWWMISETVCMVPGCKV